MTFPFVSYLSTILPAHFCDNSIQYSFFGFSWPRQLFTLLVGQLVSNSGSQDGTNGMPSASRAVIEHLRYGNAPKSSYSGTWNSKCQCRMFWCEREERKHVNLPSSPCSSRVRCCFLLPLRLLCKPSATDASPKRKTVKSKRSTSCAVLCDRDRPFEHCALRVSTLNPAYLLRHHHHHSALALFDHSIATMANLSYGRGGAGTTSMIVKPLSQWQTIANRLLLSQLIQLTPPHQATWPPPPQTCPPPTSKPPP